MQRFSLPHMLWHLTRIAAACNCKCPRSICFEQSQDADLSCSSASQCQYSSCRVPASYSSTLRAGREGELQHRTRECRPSRHPRIPSHLSSPSHRVNQLQPPALTALLILSLLQSPPSTQGTDLAEKQAGLECRWGILRSLWSWLSAVTLWGRPARVLLWLSPSKLKLKHRWAHAS